MAAEDHKVRDGLYVKGFCDIGLRLRFYLLDGERIIRYRTRSRTCNTNADGCFLASSATTSFICLHGSAHGAQKLISETRLRSWERRDLKWSGEVTSNALVAGDGDAFGTDIGEGGKL